MLVFDDSEEFRNWVLCEINLYLVTFVLPRGIQKRLSFIFHYSSNFTGGFNAASQFCVFHNFDVLLGFAEFGESVFWQVLVNAFASTEARLVKFVGSGSFVLGDGGDFFGALVLARTRSAVVVWNSERILSE